MHGTMLDLADSLGGDEVSEPRHTPGPWEVIDMGLSDGRLTIGAKEKTICDTLNDMLDSEEEHLANACLIAAAPELY